jgi:hypothetical protein
MAAVVTDDHTAPQLMAIPYNDSRGSTLDTPQAFNSTPAASPLGGPASATHAAAPATEPAQPAIASSVKAGLPANLPSPALTEHDLVLHEARSSQMPAPPTASAGLPDDPFAPPPASELESVKTFAISDLMFYNSGLGSFANSTSAFSRGESATHDSALAVDSHSVAPRSLSARRGSYAAVQLDVEPDLPSLPSVRTTGSRRKSRSTSMRSSAELASVSGQPSRAQPQHSVPRRSSSALPHATQFQQRAQASRNAALVPGRTAAGAAGSAVQVPFPDETGHLADGDTVSRLQSWTALQSALLPGGTPAPPAAEQSGSHSVALDAAAHRRATGEAAAGAFGSLGRQNRKHEDAVRRPERTTTIRPARALLQLGNTLKPAALHHSAFQLVSMLVACLHFWQSSFHHRAGS